jgi:hypothetical protein
MSDNCNWYFFCSSMPPITIFLTSCVDRLRIDNVKLDVWVASRGWCLYIRYGKQHFQFRNHQRRWRENRHGLCAANLTYTVIRLERQKSRMLMRKRGRGTLQSKKAKPTTTTTPTPAIIPVIVGSNVLPEPAFVSCASAKVKRRASPIMEMHIWRMMKNCLHCFKSWKDMPKLTMIV